MKNLFSCILILFSLNLFATNTKVTVKQYENIENWNSIKIVDELIETTEEFEDIKNTLDLEKIYNKNLHELVNKALKKEKKSLSKKDIEKINMEDLISFGETNNKSNEFLCDKYSYEQLTYAQTYGEIIIILFFQGLSESVSNRK